MYSVENPAFPKKLSRPEEEQYGPRFTGVGTQILGADDKYICQYAEESHNFWAERDNMSLGKTFLGHENMLPPKKEVPPQEFNQRVVDGSKSPHCGTKALFVMMEGLIMLRL